MKDSDKGFEDFFREAFEEAEMAPPPTVWQRVESQLGRAGAVRPLYARLGKLAVAAMLVMGVAVYLAPRLTENATNVPTTVKQNNSPSDQKSTQPAVTPDNQTIGQSETATGQDQSPAEGNGLNQEPLRAEAQDAKPSPTVDLPTRAKQAMPEQFNPGKGYRNGAKTKLAQREAPVDQPVVAINPEPLADKANPLATPADQAENRLVTSEVAQPSLILLPIPTQIDFTGLLQARMIDYLPISTDVWWMSLGGSFHLAQPNFSGFAQQVPSPYVASVRAGDRSLNDTQLGDLNANLQSATTFSVSLEVGRKLGRHFGLSTGLVYLANDFRYRSVLTQAVFSGAVSNTQNFDNVLVQRSAYLGVPLRLWVQSARASGFNYRASAGLMGQVLLQNSLVAQATNELNAGVVGSAVYDLGTYRPFLLNATGSVGLQYNFGPKWGLYTDLNYNRALQSVYSTDKLRSTPQWFGLGFGILHQF
jgi:hypothetical protein